MVRVLALLAAASLAACGATGDPLDEACMSGPGAIERALARAPAPGDAALGDAAVAVRLRTRAATPTCRPPAPCSRARPTISPRRRARATPTPRCASATSSAPRGAARSARPGIHAELQRHIERAAAVLDGAGARIAAALADGQRAGEATG